MKIIHRSATLLKKVASFLLARVFPVHWKEINELNYWKNRKRVEGSLSNNHYKYFYTEHFGLNETFYKKKFILDIGCGPRGSLEWASMASRRIGLDPLAKEYLRLGARDHQMEYLDGHAENIPIENGKCDVVFSFNSLDHVADIKGAVKEIKRVTCPGGYFLLLVEVHHPPTDCEPHELDPPSIIKLLEPEFACENFRLYPVTGNGIYASILAGIELCDRESFTKRGYMSAKFLRMADA